MTPKGRIATDFIWWKHGVIYQIYPRSFRDSDGDGVGDLKGITEKLPYLADLGVSGIWLSPINPSPMKDFGYDISDYRGIDPVFGTLDDFHGLIARAHELGIRVIMDMVFNHSSDKHPWFQEASSSTDNPKRDWYIWHKGRRGGKPNNWRAAFGGSSWHRLSPEHGHYHHSFLKEQPDLNWRNPEVRAELYDILRYWMKFGVDGFRFDVINFIVKDKRFRDNPYLFRRGLPRRYDQQHHIYDRTRPESHHYLKELRKVLDEFPDTMSVGEIIPNEGRINQAASASYLGNGTDELHLAFDFSPIRARFNAAVFARILSKQYEVIPEKGWPCHVLSNHDVSRSMTRLARGNPGKMRVLLTMLLTQKGTPFLYYGEEIGMGDGGIPRHRIMDPPGRKYWPFYRGRDPVRTPMQWSAQPGAGFTSGSSWLPIPESAKNVNVESQENDEKSLLALTKTLIRLRGDNPVLSHGDWQLLDSPPGVLAYERRYGKESFMVFLNFSSKRKKVNELDRAVGCPGARLIFRAGDFDRSTGVAGTDVSLPAELAPYDALIVQPGSLE